MGHSDTQPYNRSTALSAPGLCYGAPPVPGEKREREVKE